MTFRELCQHFHAKRVGKGKFQAKCPAHQDSHPSLSIREGREAALVKCWGGCDLADVLRAAGLTYGQLWYQGREATPKIRSHLAQERELERLQRHGWLAYWLSVLEPSKRNYWLSAWRADSAQYMKLWPLVNPEECVRVVRQRLAQQRMIAGQREEPIDQENPPQ